MDIRKICTYLGLAVIAVVALGGTAAHAAEANVPVMSLIGDIGAGLKAVGIGLGLGLVVIGGGKGIGNIGSSAVESMARQPEAAKDISGAMVLSAAFVEGATLFGIVVLFLGLLLI